MRGWVPNHLITYKLFSSYLGISSHPDICSISFLPIQGKKSNRTFQKKEPFLYFFVGVFINFCRNRGSMYLFKIIFFHRISFWIHLQFIFVLRYFPNKWIYLKFHPLEYLAWLEKSTWQGEFLLCFSSLLNHHRKLKHVFWFFLETTLGM